MSSNKRSHMEISAKFCSDIYNSSPEEGPPPKKLSSFDTCEPTDGKEERVVPIADAIQPGTDTVFGQGNCLEKTGTGKTALPPPSKTTEGLFSACHASSAQLMLSTSKETPSLEVFTDNIPPIKETDQVAALLGQDGVNWTASRGGTDAHNASTGEICNDASTRSSPKMKEQKNDENLSSPSSTSGMDGKITMMNIDSGYGGANRFQRSIRFMFGLFLAGLVAYSSIVIKSIPQTTGHFSVGRYWLCWRIGSEIPGSWFWVDYGTSDHSLVSTSAIDGLVGFSDQYAQGATSFFNELHNLLEESNGIGHDLEKIRSTLPDLPEWQSRKLHETISEWTDVLAEYRLVVSGKAVEFSLDQMRMLAKCLRTTAIVTNKQPSARPLCPQLMDVAKVYRQGVTELQTKGSEIANHVSELRKMYASSPDGLDEEKFWSTFFPQLKWYSRMKRW